MSAGWSGRAVDFLAADKPGILATLSLHQATSFRINETRQLRAWSDTLVLLQNALAGVAEAQSWRVVLEFPMRRLGRRIDALLITPRGVLVLEIKAGATSFALADRRQAEDYALDLQDFHAGSRHHPIVPILVATSAKPGSPQWPLLLDGLASTVMDTNAAGLGRLLQDLWARLPAPAAPLDVDLWEHAAYRPVPGIIDAACTLYSHNGVADIAAARADAINLSATSDAILQSIRDAETSGLHLAVFVTGIPGAGKTLCGLNTVFGTGRDAGAVFLTGNPTLVHVLREALARDAAQGDRAVLPAKRQRTKSAIQALPGFRDDNVPRSDPPHERVLVIDEAQRAWSKDHAIRKSRDRAVALQDSEPGHLLAIMGRHPDWAVVVCLIGNGQEIHDGEGGLAEWGEALRTQPKWRARAAPALRGADPRQTLPNLEGLQTLRELHLDVPMRSLRNDAVSAWVDALLQGDTARARDIAATRGPIPFQITRDLAAMRRHLRAQARGHRRAGLIASSGAKRLRADGLGSEVPHMDAGAVACWFLDRWPEDVRASDALEQVATEFSCQGLELDHVGLCWGGDLVRGQSWVVRNFVGTDWQIRRSAEAIANRLNTYRVLLTRARYGTIIWVPPGDAEDRTRTPAELDAVAAYLLRCGAAPLAPPECAEPPPDVAQAALL